MEALAAEGHEVRVVARLERFGPDEHASFLAKLAARGVAAETLPPQVRFALRGVDVRTLTLDPHLRAFFSDQIQEFDPHIILASTDDPAHLLLDIAVRAPARVVFLVRATIAVPFGPDSSAPNARRAATLRQCDGIVGVSEYVARYLRQWGGVDAIHLPISLLEPGGSPRLGSFDSPFVTLANPCAVKGISIFLALADRMPAVRFAAVPTWGANAADLAELRKRSNITILQPVDDIDDLLRQTRVLLVPSLWAEARSRIVVEAMARGVPAIASDIGGIPEAKLGVPYLIPVNPIIRYDSAVDENMVPVAQVPEQNIDPWQAALERLSTDRAHYEQLAEQSQRAALDYARNLSVKPFEQFLEKLARSPKRLAAETSAPKLSPDKQKLLAQRLRQRAAGNPWLPYFDSESNKPRLFCFPYAGAGAVAYRPWISALAPAASVSPVRLPGRETRTQEPPFESMSALVEALESALAPHLDRPFAFYGHSMGAAIAFELARALRSHGKPLPLALYCSAARAPQYRLRLDSAAGAIRQRVPGAAPPSRRHPRRHARESHVDGVRLARPPRRRRALPQLRL